jgi:hypothetical protein
LRISDLRNTHVGIVFLKSEIRNPKSEFPLTSVLP